MTSLIDWIHAVRAPFFTATIIPLSVGSVLAWHATGSFSWMIFILIMIAGIFLQAATNITNDIFDHLSGNDEANEHFSSFNGGSRVIQDKIISPKEMFGAAVVFLTVAAVLGGIINLLLPGNTFLVLGAASLFLSYFYTAPPLRMGYNGLGEIIVALGFGPLAVVAAYFSQAQMISTQALFISIPIGIMTALILYISEFQDYDADSKTDKNTWVVLFGKHTSAYIYAAMAFFAYLSIVVGFGLGILPAFTLLALLTFPLALFTIYTIFQHYEDIEELLPANKATIGLHLVFGGLIVVGAVAASLF